MNAICTACGQTIHWRATRGVRLADFTSRCCHAPLRGMTTGQTRDARHELTVRMRVLEINSIGWRREYTVTAKIRRDGEIQLGRWYSHAQITEICFGPWRLVEKQNALGAAQHYIFEADYQRLMAKVQHRTSGGPDHDHPGM